MLPCLTQRRSKMFIEINRKKHKKKYRNIIVQILVFILFCQFNQLQVFAIPIKEKNNTLPIYEYVKKTLPAIPKPNHSELASQLLNKKIKQPHAVKELNHTLQSIRDLMETILKLHDQDEVALHLKYLQAKYASLIDLDQKVRNNLHLDIEIFRKRQAQQKRFQLLNHHETNIQPILQKLNNIITLETNVEEEQSLKKIKRNASFNQKIRSFISYFDEKIKSEQPTHKPNLPAIKSKYAKPVKPDTSNNIIPLYMDKKEKHSSQLRKTVDRNLNPQPEDLSETIDTVITQEMIDLVESLNKSPAQIFEWVVNNIQVEFYYGSMKGARGTLIDKSGNDMDTASLLIALYRAADIPCRYITGTIEIPLEKAYNITGTNDTETLSLFIGSSGIPALLKGTYGIGLTSLQLEHTWIEAFVDYYPFAGAKAGDGDLWVPLSPWYKELDHKQANDLDSMTGFDGKVFIDEYLSKVRTQSPLEYFKLYIDRYLKEHQPGLSWQDGLFLNSLKPQIFRTLPNTLNFEVVAIKSEYSEISEEKRHKATIEITSDSISHTLNYCDFYRKKITLSYLPADEASKILIDNSGGIENVNPQLINLIPTLKLEGAPLATGNVVKPGYHRTLKIHVLNPSKWLERTEQTDAIVTGSYYAIGIISSGVTSDYIAERIATHISTIGDQEENTDNMDQITGEALYVALMKWYEKKQAEVFQFFQVATLNHTHCAILGKAYKPHLSFGTPVELENIGYMIDGFGGIYSPISLINDNNKLNDARIISGYNGSFHEHKIFEDLFHMEAVSTTKLLAIARERNIPIYEIDQNNIQQIKPLLNLNSKIIADIEKSVREGKKVTVHQDMIKVKNWEGAGYAFGDTYMIYSMKLINGGETIDKLLPLINMINRVKGAIKNLTNCGNPVNMVSGNNYEEEEDFQFQSIGLPTVFKRHYNSLDQEIGPFGYGWTHTYQHELQIDNENNSILYITDNGAQYVYIKNDDGTYTRPPGFYAILSKNNDNYILREKNGNERIFDSTGKLMRISDRYGNTIHLTYTDDMLTQIQDTSGRIFTIDYNDSNFIELITGPENNQWKYTYKNQNLQSTINNAGQQKFYSYYLDHKLSSKTNPLGGILIYDYYSDGKVHMELFPNGSKNYFSYNHPLRLSTFTCCTDKKGTIIMYDQNGNTTHMIDPYGYEKSYEYDDDFNVITETNKKGGITKKTYDDRGNVLTTINPFNYITTYTYEPLYNQVKTMTDPMGKTTYYDYSDKGNLIKLTDPELVTTEYDYYSNGLLKHVKQDQKIKSTFNYYPDGSLKNKTDINNHTTRMTYDSFGRLTSMADANNHTTTYILDGAGNIKTTIDAKKNETKFSYNAINLRTSFQDARGYTTIYTYNNWGKLTGVIDPMGYTKTYVYNDKYDLKAETDKNGNVTTYEYYLMRRVSKKIYADGSIEEFSYDPSGKIIQVTDSNGTTIQEYDIMNRLIRKVDTYGLEIQYTYGHNGQRKTMIDPKGGITSYEYYSNGLLKYITDPDQLRTEYYYKNDKVGRVVYPNNTETIYEYYDDDQIKQMTNQKVNGEVISLFKYEYDPVGNRKNMIDNVGKHRYFYDELNQVTEVIYADASFTKYTYDQVGNRIFMYTADETIAYTYDVNNRMLSAGKNTYTYDKNGSQLTETKDDSITKFHYNSKNRLAQVDYHDGLVNRFRYNYQGQRIYKYDKSGLTHFIYDGANILMETNEDGLIESNYLNGINHFGAIYKKDSTNKKTFLMKNALGSVTNLTNNLGRSISSIKYDIFGSIKSKTSVDIRGIKKTYTGKELDDDSSLLYYGARFYNSKIGRFISVDTYTWNPDDERGTNTNMFPMKLISTFGSIKILLLNSYLYSINNPLNKIDLDGHFAVLLIFLVYGTLLALFLQAIDEYQGDITSNADFAATFMFNYLMSILFIAGVLLSIAGLSVAGGAIYGLFALLMGAIFDPITDEYDCKNS